MWNLKTMPVNNDDEHLYTQNRGEKLAIFEALFESLPCFQCFWNLQGILIDNWSRDCQIYKKNVSSGVLKNAKFVGMDQITFNDCNKSSWMQGNKILLTRDRPEQFPSFFVRSFSMESNHYEMNWSHVSKASHFLKIFANRVDSMLFHWFLWFLKKLRFKIFRKRSHRIYSNLAIVEAIMAGIYSLKRFLKKKLLVQRNTKINKKRNGVITLPWLLWL